MSTPGVLQQATEAQFEIWMQEMRDSGCFPAPYMSQIERILRAERRVMVVYADSFFSDDLTDDDDMPEGMYAIISKHLIDCTLEVCADLEEARQFCESVGVAMDVQAWPDTPLWAQCRLN